MNTPRHAPPSRGFAALRLSRADVLTPLWKTLHEALKQEVEKLREQNDHPMDIAHTTLLRGELQALKRILALADEVGPESRQSEPLGPESASPARNATGFPVDFDQ